MNVEHNEKYRIFAEQLYKEVIDNGYGVDVWDGILYKGFKFRPGEILDIRSSDFYEPASGDDIDLMVKKGVRLALRTLMYNRDVYRLFWHNKEISELSDQVRNYEIKIGRSSGKNKADKIRIAKKKIDVLRYKIMEHTDLMDHYQKRTEYFNINNN